MNMFPVSNGELSTTKTLVTEIENKLNQCRLENISDLFHRAIQGIKFPRNKSS